MPAFKQPYGAVPSAQRSALAALQPGQSLLAAPPAQAPLPAGAPPGRGSGSVGASGCLQCSSGHAAVLRPRPGAHLGQARPEAIDLVEMHALGGLARPGDQAANLAASVLLGPVADIKLPSSKCQCNWLLRFDFPCDGATFAFNVIYTRSEDKLCILDSQCESTCQDFADRFARMVNQNGEMFFTPHGATIIPDAWVMWRRFGQAYREIGRGGRDGGFPGRDMERLFECMRLAYRAGTRWRPGKIHADCLISFR
jgi:hypothetical protein